MDVRSPLFSNLALILAGVLFLNPIVATAAQLAVDGKAGGNTSLGQAGNGVPIVNIATPNGTGLSHNRFSDYNVDQQGLILNNATARTQSTQLGGIILGNPNLQGQAAGLILNEVTGANPSHLRGYTEVAGQAARVIVANPHGITCDGCGFINTPRATLSTGRPVIEDGRLSRFDVDGGQVAIEGAGLNASNVEQFDLITRSARINAELHAQQLNIVTGRNQVDADSLAASAKADDGQAKPALAIDSSALGGMYAGAIRLVGTEAGVGVKLAGNLAASAGDIQIDAAGKLTLAQAATSGNLALKGHDVALEGQVYAGGQAEVRAQDQLAIEQSLAAAGNVGLQGSAVVNRGVVEAGVQPDNSRSEADLNVSAQQLRNAGTLIGNRQLQVSASQILDNQGGTLSGKTLTRVEAGQLGNRQGRVLAEQQLEISGAQLNNSTGLMQSQGRAAITAREALDNRQGEIRSNADLSLAAGHLDNSQAGLIASQATLQGEIGSLDNRGGTLSAQQGLNLTAGSVDTRDQGLISSGAGLTLDAGRVDASNQGEVSAKGDMALSAGEWVQLGGQLIGEGAVSLDLNGGTLDNQGGLINARAGLDLRGVGMLDNAGGEVSSSGDIAIAGQQLNNGQGGRVIAAGQLAVGVDSVDNAGAGLLSGWQGVRIEGASLDNSDQGTVSSRDGALDVILSDTLNNNGAGALVSQGAQSIQAGSLDNRAQGILSSETGIDLSVAGTLDNGNQGLISAPALSLKAGQILNQGGQIASAGNLLLTSGSLDNSAGSLSAAQALTASLTGVLRNNAAGQLASGGPLVLRIGSLDNRGGQLASQGLLALFAASLDNSANGTLAAQDGLSLELTNALVNRDGGLIYSRQGELAIKAASLDNDAGTLQAMGLIDVDISAAASNQGGRILSETGDLDLSAERLDNSGAGILASTLGSIRLALTSLFDNRSGTTQAQQNVDLTTAASGQALNAGGHLSAVAGDVRINTGVFDNQGGGLYAGNWLDLDAASFDNQGAEAGQGGKVSARTLDFSLAGTLNNTHGLIEAGDTLLLGSVSLDNRQGALRALGQSGESRLATSATLDNRGGRIEVANTNLTLTPGSLLNDGGSILHVGAGAFGLASSLLVEAGGTLVTNGALAVTAATWNHSGTLQARELTLEVGTFNQSASGQLLATQRLSATGDNWTNAGLIASDGSLDLALTGAYAGSGRLTSLGNLNLTAASLDLASTGSIAGGALTQLTLSGLASNQGQLTSSGDFTLRAATLNNYGTLGSAQQLRLYAPTLYNEGGLIFSGGDMALRSANLTNRRGHLYSLGALDIAANDASGWATRFENTSGSVESAGDMRILASTLVNQRDNFSTEMGLVSGNFDVYWNDYCDGKGCELYFRSVENYEDVIVGDQDAPAAFLTSGGNLDFLGSTFDNLYSTVSAAGDIGITVDTLRNVGMAGGEQHHYNAGYYTRNRPVYTDFINAKNLFNLYNDPNGGDYRPGEVTVADIIAIGSRDGGFFNETSYSVPISGAVVASAIIQAGGAINITATQSIDNSVVREYAAGVGQIGSQDTSVERSGNALAPAITSQLPPDLAQKQVDPLALPGFSLPVGDNGLFRLSGQGGEQGVVDASFGDSALAQQLQKASGLPTSGRSPGAHKYLIETNPALTNLKTFLGSDYLLSQLGYDPDQVQKRLGDGLFEQHLMRQAIVERTGQRYLAGLYSDEAMFRYLMDNAIASQERLGLSLGVSLSAEQVAALTHDIVWLEEREVLGEKVLVPVLYLAQAEGRLAGNGALIQGSDLNLISGGDLNNVGTLRASGNLNATAGNLFNGGLMEAGERLQLLATDSIRNAQGGIIRGRDLSLTALTGDVINERSVTTVNATGGGDRLRNDIVNNAARIEAGNSLAISAGRDIHNLGSALEAGGDARLDAGRDLVIASQAEVDTYDYRRKREQGYENSVIQHGASLEVGGDASLLAGRDAVLVGSRVDTEGNLVVGAGQDLIIDTAADEYHRYANRKKGDTRTIRQRDEVVQQGSELTAGEDISLLASGDVRLRSSTVNTDEGALLVSAGGDVSLESAQDSYYESFFQQKKKRGTFSSSSKTIYDASGETLAQGSLLGGDTVQVQAGHDINVSGSAVASSERTSLLAGNDVNIGNATESYFSEHFQQKKKSGLMGSGGIGVTLGSSSMAASQKNTTETARASTIGSVLGNVDIQAGKNLTITGSDVVAGKNINLIGDNVSIVAAQEQARSEQTYKSKTSGLTLALSGSVGSAVDSTYQSAKQARDEDDSRLSALQGIKAGLTGVQAWQAAQQNGGMAGENAGQFVGISVSLGSQKSSSQQVQEQNVSQGSSLSAGNNLNMLAMGKGQAGEDGDIRIQGSQLKAGQDMTLTANRDILLEAAANTQKLEGKTSSSGGAVGVSLGVGGNGGGLSVFASGNKGSGRDKGNGTTWTETTLDTGRQVSLDSGRDTTFKGAQVSGEQITANIGRDLSLQSLQDSDQYDSEQKNVSGGASFTFGTMTGSGYLSASQSRIESDYRSVQEQTGLFAGQGGFQIDVGNHTQLDGAVIASTADVEKNRLSTGTLGWSDIRNEAEYKSQQQSVSVSGSNSGAGEFTSNMPNGMLTAFNHGDSDSGITRSAISEGTLEIRGQANQQQDVASLSRDLENANGSISPIFDKEKEQKRLQQVQLISEIGAQTMDIIRTQGELKAQEAQRDPEQQEKARLELALDGKISPTDAEIAQQIRNTVMSEYGTGSDLQRAAQAVTAALQGLAGGNLAAALAGASAPELANAIKHATAGNEEARLMAHAVLGALVAQAQGNSAAVGATGAAVGELIASQLYLGKKVEDLTEGEKQTVSALSALAAGLAGAVVGGDTAGAIVGAQGGKNAVENNWLSTRQKEQYNKEYEEAKTPVDKLKVVQKWKTISLKQDVETGIGVSQGIYEGLAGTGLETLNGVAAFMRDPRDQWSSLKELASSEAIKQVLGNAYNAFWQEVQEVSDAFEYGGDQNARALGYKTGAILAIVIAAAATGGSANANGLSKIGVSLTAEQAGALASSAGTRVATYLERVKKTGYDEDVPRVDAKLTVPDKQPNPDTRLGATDGEFVGQPHRFDPKDFSNYRQLDASDVNLSHSNNLGTDYIPYKNGTLTTERYLQPGEKFYSVEYPGQTAPGGWATPKQYTSIEQARKELALLPEFKDSSGGLVIREYTVKKPTPVREGTVGGLKSVSGKFYEGGGDQIEFLFDRGKRNDPKWKEFLSAGERIALGD